MKNIKINNKVWFVVNFIVLLLCLFFFNSFYQNERQNKINEIINHQKLHAKQASKSFSELFENWNGILNYLSHEEKIIQMNKNGEQLLREIRDIYKTSLKGITRTDKNGVIIFTTPYFPNSIGTDISKQKHMIKILTYHQPVISDVFKAVQGFQAIVIHYPIFKNGIYNGSIAFLFDFEKISKKILDQIKIGKTGKALLISEEGVELYNSYRNTQDISVFELEKNNQGRLLLAKNMLSGKEGIIIFNDYHLKSKEEENQIAYYVPIKILNSFWSLAITYSEEEMISSLSEFRNKLIILFALIFLGGVLSSYFGIKGWLVLKEKAAREKAEKDFKESETRYKSLVENINVGFFQLNDSQQIINVNQNCVKLFGYNDSNELNNLQLKNLLINEEDINLFFEELENLGAVKDKEFKFRTKDGKYFWASVNAVVLRNDEGKSKTYLGSIKDITENKRFISLLENSIKEKDILIQEIFHRTKNNMQVIYSLMELYSMSCNDVSMQKVFREMGGRIQSMALVHKSLFESQQLSNVPLKLYLQKLIKYLSESFQDYNCSIDVKLNMEEYYLLFDIVLPCGLFINEIIIFMMKNCPTNNKTNLIITAQETDKNQFEIRLSSELVINNNKLNSNDELGISLFIKLIEMQLRTKINCSFDKGIDISFSFNKDLYFERI